MPDQESRITKLTKLFTVITPLVGKLTPLIIAFTGLVIAVGALFGVQSNTDKADISYQELAKRVNQISDRVDRLSREVRRVKHLGTVEYEWVTSDYKFAKLDSSTDYSPLPNSLEQLVEQKAVQSAE